MCVCVCEVSLWQEVELDNFRLSVLPRTMVLPTGSSTLLTFASPSSCSTEPRGTYTQRQRERERKRERERYLAEDERPRVLSFTELKSATSPSHGARPSFQLLGLPQSVLGLQNKSSDPARGRHSKAAAKTRRSIFLRHVDSTCIPLRMRKCCSRIKILQNQ